MESSHFINHQRASDFLRGIKDPIVGGLVKHAYEITLIIDATPQGQFDIDYFFRIMEMFLRDREILSRALLGEYGEDKTGLGA